MIYSLLFVLSFTFSYINIIVLYKFDGKISLVHSMVLSYITQICLGAIGAQILSFCSIYVGRASMSIIYLIIGIVLALCNIKNRKAQRYTINRMEIYSVVVILIGFISVFLMVFTHNIVLAYQNSDPAVHFMMAKEVVEKGKLSAMYFASLYNALFIEIGQPFIAEINSYKLFIIADSSANLLNVLMFYCMADKLCKSKSSKKCLPIIALLYFMGWPFFNYAIGGFVYFGWGITLISYVLYLLFILNECTKRSQQITAWVLIFSGCFCTVVCYMLFVPTLTVIVLYGIVTFLKKSGVKISKRQLLCGILILVIMGVIAFAIAFYGFFGGSMQQIFYSLQLDGWIQNEPYKDFLFLFPVAIYMTIIRYKNKKSNILYFAFVTVIIYISITMVCSIMGKISAYYFYKEYYVLWLICWLICVDAMEHIFAKDKILVYAYTGVAVTVAAINLFGGDTNTILRERGLVPDEVVGGQNPAALSIYGRAHIFIAQDREEDINDKTAFIDMSQFLRTNYESKISILFTSSSYMGKWFKPFVGGERIWINTREKFEEALKNVQNGQIDLVVIHQNTEIYRENRDLMNEFESIYDNGYYGIYKISN